LQLSVQAVGSQGIGSQYLTILEQFQAFYLEIIDLKRSARSEILPAGTMEMLPPGGRAEEIWRQAAAILDRQSQEMIHAGPIASGLHREARFVMAALADEVFVHPAWEGTEYWLSHLLETRLFHTHSAGEVFFIKLGSLMARNDPADDQLAVIYLMALALGFRGKYAGEPGGETTLQALRARLYDLIVSRNPRLQDDSRQLFPEAYLSTVHEGVARRLPAPKKWVLMAVGVVIFWLLVSTGVWRILSGGLSARLDNMPLLVAPETAKAPAAVHVPEATK
jgi:type VI secretion system protein ImpK